MHGDATLRILSLFALALLSASRTEAQAPPIVDDIDFNDLVAGQTVDPNRYQHRRVVLRTNPGYILRAVERDGPSGHFQRSIGVVRSVGAPPGEPRLFIEVRFVVPGTDIGGSVQNTDIQALDRDQHGYDWAYFDIHGNPLTYGSNDHDWQIGEGWYWSDGPIGHRMVFTMNGHSGQYLDNVRFSRIMREGEGVLPCTNCVLGLYDDFERTSSLGQVRGPTKEVYIGLDLVGFDGLRRVEFSVDGLRPFIVLTEFFHDPVNVFGPIEAPADSSDPGGVNISWNTCLPPNVTIGKLTLVNTGDWPLNHVLSIRRRFPPVDPTARVPLFRLCESLGIPNREPRTQAYVLNPTVIVENLSWSQIKSLYRH